MLGVRQGWERWSGTRKEHVWVGFRDQDSGLLGSLLWVPVLSAALVPPLGRRYILLGMRLVSGAFLGLRDPLREHSQVPGLRRCWKSFWKCPLLFILRPSLRLSPSTGLGSGRSEPCPARYGLCNAGSPLPAPETLLIPCCAHCVAGPWRAWGIFPSESTFFPFLLSFLPF